MGSRNNKVEINMVIHYKIFKFARKARAEKKAMQIERLYGYMPTVFKATKNGISNYVVIKPRGLKRI